MASFCLSRKRKPKTARRILSFAALAAMLASTGPAAATDLWGAIVRGEGQFSSVRVVHYCETSEQAIHNALSTCWQRIAEMVDEPPETVPCRVVFVKKLDHAHD